MGARAGCAVGRRGARAGRAGTAAAASRQNKHMQPFTTITAAFVRGGVVPGTGIAGQTGLV